MELVVEGLVNIIAVLAMVVGLALTGWWAMGLLSVHSREQEEQLPSLQAPAGIEEKLTGIPPVLTTFFVLIGVSLLGYILAIWLTGATY